MLLQVNNLCVKNIKENRKLIERLSFILNARDKTAIIGDEGNGKSTLLKALYDQGLVSHCEITGVVKTFGKIGYLEQDIASIWGKCNVIDYLLQKKPDDLILIEDYTKLIHLRKVLSSLYFKDESFDEQKKIENFSGGEIIKLGLAKILLQEPDIIFLDEPSNDLDFQTILFLEEFILSRDEPILFVSHDRRLLENTANSIIHLHQIKKKQEPKSIYQAVSYTEYNASRLAKNESQLMQAKKQRAEYKTKLEKFRQIYQKVEYQQNQVVRDPTTGRLLKKKIHVLKSQEKRLDKEKKQFTEIPEKDEFVDLFFDKDIYVANRKNILNLTIKELKNKEIILSKNITLNIKGQQHIAITGCNGIGKTTLLKEIYHELMKTSDLKVGYMPQKYDEVLDSNKTALETLLKEPDKVEEARVRKIMGASLFTSDEMLYKISDLSGGQKAKLLLLKMVLDRCNVILLDEPTRNISPINSKEIYRLLNDYRGCIIAITHDRTFLEEVFDEIWELTKDGLFKQ